MPYDELIKLRQRIYRWQRRLGLLGCNEVMGSCREVSGERRHCCHP